jgi:very-short-patch-repair endonuclease
MRGYARALRRRSTEAEKVLWARLRARQLERVKFKRQVPLFGYIVDFAALDRKLVIEIDGGQPGQQIGADATRTNALENAGYHVIRFWNNDVLSNLDGVLDAIVQELHLNR